MNEYRSVGELTTEEKLELKNAIFVDAIWGWERFGDSLPESFREYVDGCIHAEDIPDGIIYACFTGVNFVKEDFWCNVEGRS